MAQYENQNDSIRLREALVNERQKVETAAEAGRMLCTQNQQATLFDAEIVLTIQHIAGKAAGTRIL